MTFNVKSFTKNEQGSATIQLIWIVVAIVSIAIIVLAVSTVYFSVSHASSLLERTTSITVNQSQNNNAVRDLVFNVENSSAEGIVKHRLLDAGLIGKENDTYEYNDLYTISDMSFATTGNDVNIQATLKINMPWRLLDSLDEISIPISVKSHILYINY